MTHALVATPLGCSGLFRPARRDVRAQAQQQQPGGAPPQGVRPQCYEGPALRASRIPTPEEDREVAHSAFLHAFQSAQPEKLRIHGMQEFAGAVSAGRGRGVRRSARVRCPLLQTSHSRQLTDASGRPSCPLHPARRPSFRGPAAVAPYPARPHARPHSTPLCLALPSPAAAGAQPYPLAAVCGPADAHL